MPRWGALSLVLLLTGCATGTPVGLRLAGGSIRSHHFAEVEPSAGMPPTAPLAGRVLASAGGGGSSPAALVARTSVGALPRVDAFEELLLNAGLDERDALPVQGSPLTPQAAARLLAVLLKKPVTLGNFPPRMAVGHLLLEVLEGGEVSREELLRRVDRFARVAVLRPDGYLAWARTGCTQQKAVGPVEWKDDAFRAGPLELGRFYVSSGASFQLADERMQPVGPSVAEVFDDADVIGRSLDGAQEAFFELAMAIGKMLTYPMDSIASLQHLPAGVAALIASSPAYFERFKYMTRGEQIQTVAKLTTSLLATGGVAGGTTRTVTGALGVAEATVPVLSISAEGMLVLERVAVPVGKVATAMGPGVGGVYVLSTASGGGPRPVGGLTGRGSPRHPNDKAPENVQSNVRENESARVLADNGYFVEQNPPLKPNGKKPDYRINGEYYDCYAPSTSNARNIADRIREAKVLSGQADRIVLNLEDSGVSLEAMRHQLVDWPVPGLKEVLAIKGGKVVRLFP